MAKTMVVLLAVAAFSVSLVGCGGDNPQPPTTPTTMSAPKLPPPPDAGKMPPPPTTPKPVK